MNRIKLTDKRLVFHSFRHGTVSRLRQVDIPRELRKRLVGPSAVEDTHDSYGLVEQDYSTERKLDAIKTLNFGDAIDYAGLEKTDADVSRLEQGAPCSTKGRPDLTRPRGWAETIRTRIKTYRPAIE